MRFYTWELMLYNNQVLTLSSFIGNPQTYQSNTTRLHDNMPLQTSLWQTCCKLKPVLWHYIMQQINNPKPLVLMINITIKIPAFQRCFFCFPFPYTLNMKSLWLEKQRHINYSHIWLRKQKQSCKVYGYLLCYFAITSSALQGREENLFQTGTMGEHLKYLR